MRQRELQIWRIFKQNRDQVSTLQLPALICTVHNVPTKDNIISTYQGQPETTSYMYLPRTTNTFKMSFAITCLADIPEVVQI